MCEETQNKNHIFQLVDVTESHMLESAMWDGIINANVFIFTILAIKF